MRVTVVAFLALCAFAAPASSHHLPVSAGWKIAQSLPIADAAWPDSLCAGRLQARTSPDLDAQGEIGGRYMGGCVLEIRSDLPPREFCVAVVHEAGHAAGLWHSEDPANVMFPDGGTFPPCDAVAHSVPVHLAALARERSAQRSSHQWACRGDSRTQVCVGIGRHTVGEARFVRRPDGTLEEELRYRPRLRTTKHPQARRRGGARSGPR